ncbi:hypothetical protein DH86_00003540, partial [Scytalidium sp. 3C]
MAAQPAPAILLNSTSPLPLSNGHPSFSGKTPLTNDDAPFDSESDLSDVGNPAVEEPSIAVSNGHQSDFGAEETEESVSSAEEAQDESEDADFDLEESQTEANGKRHDRSSSAESRRPAKRKHA